MCCRGMTSSKERAERGEIGGIVNREADLQSPFGVTFGFTVGCRRRLRPEAVGAMGERFLSDKLNAARISEFRRLLPVYKGNNLQAGRSTWVQWRHDASASVLMGPPVHRALRLPSTRLILLFSVLTTLHNYHSFLSLTRPSTYILNNILSYRRRYTPLL